VGVHIVVVDVGSDVREQLVADLVRRAAENDEIHRHVVFSQKFADAVHRHPERLILGIAENAGGDQRKCHRLAAMLLRQRKARPVAGGELFPLAVLTAVPHGADGVDHIFARQAVCAGDLGLASPAAAQRPALSEQFRPRRPVDAAIHAASAQQRFLRRVDDGVHTHFRDVVSNDDKGHIMYRLHSNDFSEYCSRIHSVLQWTLGRLIVLIENSRCWPDW
jgi:hypothetical protein